MLDLNKTVRAVDGAEVAPDHHEVANCCLINVSSVIFRYAAAPRAGQAEFASEPQLLFQREEIDELADGAADLRFGFGGGGDLDARRMIAESKRLAALMRMERHPVSAPNPAVSETRLRSTLAFIGPSGEVTHRKLNHTQDETLRE